MVELISHSEEETKQIAMKIASKLNIGNILVLTGDLGSGKTKFTEGILEYFGFKDEISSPTFTIVNEHISDKINVYHFDVYRLEDSDEFLAIGGDEYFEKGISIIEWGEIIDDVLPRDAIKIEFSRDLENDNERKLMISNLEI